MATLLWLKLGNAPRTILKLTLLTIVKWHRMSTFTISIFLIRSQFIRLCHIKLPDECLKLKPFEWFIWTIWIKIVGTRPNDLWDDVVIGLFVWQKMHWKSKLIKIYLTCRFAFSILNLHILIETKIWRNMRGGKISVRKRSVLRSLLPPKRTSDKFICILLN